MAREIELKLALDASDLARLRRLSLLRPMKQARARTRQLNATYFDTPSLSLKAREMALRVRDDGRSRRQTLKVGNENVNGAQERQEYEAPIEGERPDPTLIDDAGLRALFEREHLAEQLQPLFATIVKRSEVPLRFVDSEIMLALDEGEIRTQHGREPICEAELELVTGAPRRLYELALLLTESLPFRIARDTKASRGYRLAGDAEERPQPITAAKIRLKRDMPAAEAFVTIARARLNQLRGNEDVVFLGSDPEGVHQMRVAVRQLRALVGASRGVLVPAAADYLRQELRWLQRRLGPARDWDVFLAETLAPLERRLPDESSLPVLRELAEAAQHDAYAAARDLLLDRRYTRFILQLNLWLEDSGWLSGEDGGRSGARPVREIAAVVLDKRCRQVDRLARKHKRLTTEQLHEVRLNAKKLRYAAESFRSLYKGGAKPFIGAVAGIQDHLGALNDAVVGRGLIEDLELRAAGREAHIASLSRAARVLGGWQAARIDAQLADLPQVLAAYRAAPRFWKA